MLDTSERVKFQDDTRVVRLITGRDDSAHMKEVQEVAQQHSMPAAQHYQSQIDIGLGDKDRMLFDSI